MSSSDASKQLSDRRDHRLDPVVKKRRSTKKEDIRQTVDGLVRARSNEELHIIIKIGPITAAIHKLRFTFLYILPTYLTNEG